MADAPATDPTNGAAQQLADFLGLGSLSGLSNAVCNYDSRGWLSNICFQNVTNVQLDIVGFLAILGEGSVLATAQVATLSKMTWLPRLLPAPQALMKSIRPTELNSAKGHVTALESGNHRDYVNFVGNALLDAEALPKFSVRCVRIRRKNRPHSESLITRVRRKGNNSTAEDAQVRGTIRAKAFGALWWVAVLGCLTSITLLGLAIAFQDGFAVIAVVVLSLISSIVGVSNKWNLQLAKASAPGQILPPGDVVIRYPKGNYLIVQCEEDVARELYFAPEDIEYTISHNATYRLISLIGTILLMVGVVALGNSTTYLQVGFAGSYIMLNAGYWLVAALPAKSHWDFSCFEIEDQCFSDCPALPRNYGVPGTPLKEHKKSLLPFFRKSDNSRPQHHVPNPSPNAFRHARFVAYPKNFTEALWRAIVATKDTEWVKVNKAMPVGPAWDRWLEEAGRQIRSIRRHEEEWERIDSQEDKIKVHRLPLWDAHGTLLRYLKEEKAAKIARQEKEQAEEEAVAGAEITSQLMQRKTSRF